MSIAIRQITTEMGVITDGSKEPSRAEAAAVRETFAAVRNTRCGDLVIWDNPPLLHSRR